MGLVHILPWILFNIYCISAQSSQKEKTTFGYNHCKSSKIDIVCEATIHDCCPEGWKLIDEKCYFFEKQMQKSLIESEKYCKELNATIFVPNSLEELQNILLNVPHSTTTWVGVRKENQVIPHSDISGIMDMSTLDWNNDPYVEDYANVSMLMCDAVRRYYGDSVSMQPCGMPFHFVCEKSAEPEPPATVSNGLIGNVSSVPKPERTALLLNIDAAGEYVLDKIVPEEEIRRYMKDVHTDRMFSKEMFLNRTEAGEEEEEQTVRYVHFSYATPREYVTKNRQKYEERLKLLRKATRDLDIDIKRVEMYFERQISVHDELIENMEDDKKRFCAKLAQVKRERYLKSVTIDGN